MFNATKINKIMEKMFIFCIFRKEEDKIKREGVLKNREGDFKKCEDDCLKHSFQYKRQKGKLP